MRLFPIAVATWLSIGPTFGQTVVRDLVADPPSAFFGDQFGTCLAGTTDLDGDLVPDLLVGAPEDDDGGVDAGMVRAYSGRTGAVLWTRYGSSAGSQFGCSLCALSDIDGDGRADFAAGAYRESAPASASGAVRLLSGATGTTIHTLAGAAANERLGFRLARVRDVDGDGRDDFAVAAIGSTIPNAFVRLCSGASGATIWTTTGVVAAELAEAGDVDGDGVSDVVTGDSNGGPVGPGGYARGEARILSGPNGNQLWIQNGTGATFLMGSAVCTVGDRNGDGKSDVAVGAVLDNTAGIDAGSVRIFSPALGTELGALYPTSSPGILTYYYGSALANLGDLDGDSSPELAIASGEDGTGFGRGRIDVRRTVDGALLWSSLGTQDYDYLGVAVAALGDLNGDAVPDVAASSVSGLGPSPGGYVRVHLAGWVSPTHTCTPKTNSQGCVPETSFEGTLSVSISSLTLRVTNVLALQPGLLFLGRTSAATPFAGGTLCIGGSLIRTGMQGSGGSTGCSGSYSSTITASSLALAGISVGSTVYGQFWSRDPGFAPPNHVGLSDAIRFPVCP